jgi:hypothetical protein
VFFAVAAMWLLLLLQRVLLCWDYYSAGCLLSPFLARQHVLRMRQYVVMMVLG